MKSTNNPQTHLPQSAQKPWCVSCALKCKSRNTASISGLSVIDKGIELCFLEKQIHALEQEYEAKAFLDTKAPANTPEAQSPQSASAVPTADCTVGQLAKQLCHEGVNIGRNTLFAWLRRNGYLYKIPGGGHRVARPAFSLDLLTIRLVPYQRIKKNQTVVKDHYPQVWVTPKGQYLFAKVLLWEKEQGQQP